MGMTHHNWGMSRTWATLGLEESLSCPHDKSPQSGLTHALTVSYEAYHACLQECLGRAALDLTVLSGLQSGNYVYANFGKVAPAGGPAPSLGTPVNLTFKDGSFSAIGQPQPRDGVVAPGPVPLVPTIPLASEASSAPALPSTAGSALPPAGAVRPAGL